MNYRHRVSTWYGNCGRLARGVSLKLYVPVGTPVELQVFEVSDEGIFLMVRCSWLAAKRFPIKLDYMYTDRH